MPWRKHYFCRSENYWYFLDMIRLTNGSHTITVSATDSDPNPDSGSANATVTVSD